MPVPLRLTSRLAATGGATAVTIGAIALAGWALDAAALRRLWMGELPMLPNTALGAIAAGVAVLLLRRTPVAPTQRTVARVLGVAVLALGALTFLERVAGFDFGIDRLLFMEAIGALPYRPLGRMATNSTVAFMMAGAALLLVDQGMQAARGARLLGTLGLVTSGAALLGHLYGARALYQLDEAAGMAVPTALAFFAMHFGIVVARPEGWVAVLFSQGSGGMLARRLLAAVALVPLVLGRVLIYAREESLVSRESGVAVFVVTVMAILFTVVLRAATAVQLSDWRREATLEREAAARQEAERATRVKNDFLAMMSHELRTPLNAIIGYGSLLADGIPDPVTTAQRSQLARISSSARHLLALIDEVLTLTRVELGEERITPTRVSVAKVAEEAVMMIQPQAREKGLELQVELPPDPGIVESDADKIRQALLNLLTNAVKFTEAGEVRLRVEPDDTNDAVRFVVEDTGIGIAAEHQGRIFDSFWQVDQSATRRAGGVGLGLHLTRQVMRLLGGEVSVTSTEGVGSAFSILLPRRWWGHTSEVAAQRQDGGRRSDPSRAAVPA